MKYYIATSLANAARAKTLKFLLDRNGHHCTYNWMAHGAAGHLGEAALADIAIQEFYGVTVADVIIVLLPGGKGTHTELGMAIAMGKPIVIWDETKPEWVCDDSTCSFYWLPGIKRRLAGQLDRPGFDLLVKTAEQLHLEEKLRRSNYATR